MILLAVCQAIKPLSHATPLAIKLFDLIHLKVFQKVRRYRKEMSIISLSYIFLIFVIGTLDQRYGYYSD